MQNVSSQRITDFLEKQLERTNYWLSFAEAKNAALLAFNIAAVAFLSDFQKDIPVFCTIIMIALVVSSLICLYSFIPKDPSVPKPGPKFLPTNNLLFWKDIAYIEDEKKYLESVVLKYFPNDVIEAEDRKLYIDFCCEIVINSRIAKEKYSRFSIALHIDFLAFILSILLLMIA